MPRLFLHPFMVNLFRFLSRWSVAFHAQCIGRCGLLDALSDLTLGEECVRQSKRQLLQDPCTICSYFSDDKRMARKPLNQACIQSRCHRQRSPLERNLKSTPIWHFGYRSPTTSIPNMSISAPTATASVHPLPQLTSSAKVARLSSSTPSSASSSRSKYSSAVLSGSSGF